ncbi:MAG: 3-phosphoshikimate 1-carboxyvinyltransferase [Acidimicrobiia bacterium]
MTLPTELGFGGVRPLRGRLRLPGDKSISHRALLFAALATGRSRLTNLATGDDVLATRAALDALGVGIRTGVDAVTVSGTGLGGWREPEAVLDCANSGTTMRVLSGALAGRPFLSVLTGDASLRQRPMRRVSEPLRAMGARVDGRADGAFAPLVIRGDELHGVRHDLPVASAQVKSALMLAGLQAEGTTEIISPAISRDHSERMLAALGVPIEVEGRCVRVQPGAPEPFQLDVPGDPSSAAFFVVAALITPGSDLTIESLSLNPTRTGFVEVLRRMGAEIEIEPNEERCGEPVGELRVHAGPLIATTIEGDEIPNVQDEIPALAVAAAFADGVTEVRGAAELAVKESNRIGALHQELSELGLAVETRADGLVIRGGKPRAALLKSHGDHRMAMALAVAANAIDGQSTVRGWQAVSSSYPEFADDFARLTSAS